MMLTVSDDTATRKFLFMDNQREEKLPEFLNNHKIKKGDVILLTGVCSRDTFFVNSINPIETEIYMKPRQVKNA